VAGLSKRVLSTEQSCQYAYLGDIKLKITAFQDGTAYTIRFGFSIFLIKIVGKQMKAHKLGTCVSRLQLVGLKKREYSFYIRNNKNCNRVIKSR